VPSTGPIKLGIDIGGTAVKAALVVGDADPITAVSDLYERPSLDELTEHVKRTVTSLSKPGQSAAPPGVSASPHSPTHIGLSLPGPLSDAGVLEAASNVPCLIGLDLRTWLRETLGCGSDTPIHLLTDTLATALSEHARAPYPGRALYLAIGTGVGGAVLDDGQPLTITRGTPGHLGHMDVSGGDPDAPATPGAGRGALEAYIGFRALERAGIPTADPDWPSHPNAQPALGALARAVRIFLVIYRPARIVFMGGVGHELGPALPTVRRLVEDDLSPAAPTNWELAIGEGGPFAAAIGAAMSADAVK
jgi:glucokinase